MTPGKHKAMEVIVTGGRTFTDEARLFAFLDRLHAEQFHIKRIIQGYARGADELASRWADARGIERLDYPANWEALGRAAGAIRNRAMLDKHPEAVVVAFPGGKGTANMIRQASALNRTVIYG